MTDRFDELSRFIAASFPSVWALEVLLLLKHEGRPVSCPEMVSRLRASDLVVAKALDALVAAGLVSVDQESVRYLPVDREVDRNVDRVEELYRSRPNMVRRIIVAAGASRAEAFANAFRLRRGSDD